MAQCKKGHPPRPTGEDCAGCTKLTRQKYYQRHKKRIIRQKASYDRSKRGENSRQLINVLRAFLGCWQQDSHGGHTLPRESLSRLQDIRCRALELVDRPK